MSKTRHIISKGQKSSPLRFKFKIGGRKNPVSALLLSNEDILSKISSPSTRGRDKAKLLQVAHQRGLAV